ncbi:hypothetical protein ACI65C_010179 [Semiaphis heraclei]
MTILRRTDRDAFSGCQMIAAWVVGKGERGRRDTKWAASDSVAPGAPRYHSITAPQWPVINQTVCRSVLSNVDTLTQYSGRGAFQRAFRSAATASDIVNS